MPQLNVDFTPPENNSLTSGSHLVLRRVLAYPREKASRAFLDLFENVVPAHGFEAGRAGVIEAGRAGVNDEEFLLRVWEGVTHGVWRQ